MEAFKRCGIMALFGCLALGLPVAVFSSAFLDERTSDRIGTLIAVATCLAVASALGAGAAARVCAAMAPTPKYGFLDLAWRGFAAGLIASFIVAMLPGLLHFDGGIYIWPLVIGAPVGSLTVVWFHLQFNRR